MSTIINVTYPKNKFEHIAVSLTFKEAQLLCYLKSRATAISSAVNPLTDRYSIVIYGDDFKILENLVEPIGRIL